MSNQITVKIVNSSANELPAYSTTSSAGMDLRANLSKPLIIEPMERRLIPTGLRVALPEGYEMQLRPRSGLALKQGISLINTPGTIDADYRGEIGVIVINFGSEPVVINPGDRICQAVVSQYTRVNWLESNDLDTTDRGEGGFGHTGQQ